MMRGRRCVNLSAAMLLLLGGCVGQPVANPFKAPPVAIDGVTRAAENEITNVGSLAAGTVLRIRVDGDAVKSVLLLRQDETEPSAGVIVGGGRRGADFQTRIAEDGVYAVYLQFDATTSATARRANLTVSPGDPAFTPPSEQYVQVAFAPGYLTEPGLFDPEGMSAEDKATLEQLAAPVREAVLSELHRVFDGTPVRILSENDPLPDAPVSRLTYRPERVVSDDQTVIDAALPPPDPARPECQVRVVFGSVLPDGTEQDPGNQVRDDEAIVYVGSFQGRGASCHTSAINSFNNAVLSLAQSGAHEIGHLVGLYHVEQIDVMNRAATLALLRELSLQRGQIQVDRIINGQAVGEVVTNVLQEPERYFRFAFSSPAP